MFRSSVSIPAHRPENRAWRTESGPRADREVTSICTWVPPRIGDLAPQIPGELAAQCESAIAEISRLDAEHGPHLRPLAGLLLRAESIASSKIENEHASVEDYVRALHGNRSNRSAITMANATGALETLVNSALRGEDLLSYHRQLMQDTGLEAMYAGQHRSSQNWIGGSDYSPRGALFIPPPPEEVSALMADLLQFSRRTDLPTLPQAAIAHAQFESIHPFGDGNGRTGRALLSVILRHRGHTQHTTVPIAAALAAARDEYFAALTTYREGEAGPIVSLMATSAQISARESRATAARLSQLPDEWRLQAGNPRGDSALGRLIEQLCETPVITSTTAADIAGASAAAAHRALGRLVETGIVRELTGRRRHQIWGASAVLHELDDLAFRIAERVRGDL